LESAPDLRRWQLFPAFPQSAAIALGLLRGLKDRSLVGVVRQRPPVLFQISLQVVHVLHRGVTAHKASEPSAGRIVDHVDQQDLFPATLQPVVIAGVPLHQLPEATAPRSPFMHLLDTLLPRPPQLRSDHPLPHRLPAHVDFVLLRQVLRCQCWPEPAIHRLRKNGHRLSFGIGTQLTVGRQPSQPVSHDLVSAPLQFPQQPSHVPFCYPQLFGCLLLGDQLLLRFLQGHQAVPFGLRHQ
jgi:hypothetical protein